MSLKQRLELRDDPIFLMDGSAFIYRGFFAGGNMQRSDGFPTNAIFVVARILLRFLKSEQPQSFVFVQDGHGKNFRHALYSEYKANRMATPDALDCQFDPIKRLVKALGIPLLTSVNCEADDYIASLVTKFSKDYPIIIMSGDKDLKQCLADNVFMWDPAGKTNSILTQRQFKEETGLLPSQWADFQALTGDTADNIPGVPGIGPKTAQEIFQTCNNLEMVKANFAKFPERIRKRLRDHLDKMFTWRELTRLATTYCQEINLSDLALHSPDKELCLNFMKEFELFSLQNDLASLFNNNLLKQTKATQTQTEQIQIAQSETEQTQVKSQKIEPSNNLNQLPLFQLTRQTTDNNAPLLNQAKEAKELPTIPIIENIQDLPNCQGQKVAIIFADNETSPYLALDSAKQEWQWSGDFLELWQWAIKANIIISADFKIILRKLPANLLLDYLKQTEISMPKLFDLSLVAYLLNPEENDYSWQRLCQRVNPDWLGPEWLESRLESDKLEQENLSLESKQNLVEAIKFNSAKGALFLANSLEKQMEKADLAKLYQKLEQPLTLVLALMQERGIAIDPKAFQIFLKEVQDKLEVLTAEIYQYAGKTFNLRSAKQLAEIIYTDLKLATPKKTGTGQFSTSQQVLEKLAGKHPLIDAILQFRHLEKMRSTYLEPLPRLMDSNSRLHSNFNQMATATGRLSSSNPNLQNIPIRGDLGKRMRACFVARPDYLLIAADYSQIELRVLAHISQAKALVEAFQNNADIHASTAALIYDCQQEEVSSEQRRNAKAVNFGLLYGMGAQKLGQELKISQNEAKKFIERYFEKLSDLKIFYEQVLEVAKEQGFVTTLAGRRRLLTNIHSNNNQELALAKRQAINTVIQGSAADIIKLAMLAVETDPTLCEYQANLLLQVHDELIVEVPKQYAEQAAEQIAKIMANVCPNATKLSVPLVVDCGIGTNWYEAHN